MKPHAVLLLLALSAPVPCSAEDKPKGEGKKDAPKRTDLLRFYDKKLHEHVYTYGDGEPAAWRKHADMESETVMGQVALEKEEGTTRLFRAIGKDRRHYFYTEKPAGLKDFELEDFIVYVWTKPGDERIPLHACLLPDGTDLFLDPEQKKVTTFADETQKGIGINRKNISKMLYVYPASKPDEKKEQKK